jgi:ABC-type multidrug transport system fused ATPase/permease subunit
MALGQSAPSFIAFGVAQGAAPRIYEIIDRPSAIDPLADEGILPASIKGDITFNAVDFNYHSRAVEGGAPVLKNLSLAIGSGTTHALVGASGCGKSSALGLIERFYDVNTGSVTVDGVDVRELNVRWLRSQMGYVGQMPTLFHATIRENIACGAAMKGIDGERHFADLTGDEIIAAAKLANAHKFISQLPEGYDTLLGERGAMLSGGQKQRICIARAIVCDPKILLLDEATSALDAKSESLVQDALERAAGGRTTVVIAHRLSTVRNADTISVFKEGKIVESGRHIDLIQNEGGAYRELVQLQDVSAENDPGKNTAADADDSPFVDPDVISKQLIETARKTGAFELMNVAIADADGEVDIEKPADIDSGVLKRAFILNSGEGFFIFLGVIGAVLAGVTWPVSALLLSEVTIILGNPNNGNDINFWCGMYVLIGLAALVGNAMQLALLGISGERLTRKMRAMMFRGLLRQEMGFFDRKENAIGSLTARLATEASFVKGITGDAFGAIAVALSTILVGIAIAFWGCWRLALVVLVYLPAMSFAGAVQMKSMSGFDAGANKMYEESGAIASEAVDNVRTIAGLGVQSFFIGKYEDKLAVPLANGKKSAIVAGVAFGVAEASMFGLPALAFWVGAKFIEQGHCDFLGLMRAENGIFYAGMTLGNLSIILPDIGKSRLAATNIFRLLDRVSEIDPCDDGGKKLSSIRGMVDIKDSEFEYPSRPDVAVLRGLSLGVTPGKTLALVGESGCGKSTVVGLLERFYDVRDGSVMVEGEDLRSMNLQNLRSHMALVQQEPDLFSRTVNENIAYGLSKVDGTPVSQEMIETASKAANAHNFVTELPLGYDTQVGERGGALSGGQRQRVAIARALVRQPRVLLLDEVRRIYP